MPPPRATSRLLKTELVGICPLGNGGIPDARSAQSPTQHAGHRGFGERVPRDHPLRRIKAVPDAALVPLSPTFDRMYTQADRTSVPPEQLLKASPLIALYKGRSERTSCEEFEYNLPCRWCLDMDLLAHDTDRPYLTRRYGRPPLPPRCVRPT